MASREELIDVFVRELAVAPINRNARNPWDHSDPENAVRRMNLRSYFLKVAALDPRILLVGEAPGYRGCGRVGVPFTSERLLASHPFFADEGDFRVVGKAGSSSEATATIMWRTLDLIGHYPLLWGAYPFHPHQPGNPKSNRAPTAAELAVGKRLLERLISIFQVERVVAVGRIAAGVLADMELEAVAVRHPSHGGARAFAEGLEKVFAEMAL